MLRRLVQFSLRRCAVALALAGALVGYGVYSLSQARYDVFPAFAPPEVVVQTEAPGLAPEQVERLVTLPIENAINGAPGVESLRSGSIEGLSVITTVFRPDSDVYLDRQVVAERVAEAAGSLPQGIRPLLTPLTSSTSIVMAIGLTSQKPSLMSLTTLADWTVRPELLAVPGVAKVAVFGAERKQIQIQYRPEELVRHGLSLGEVIAAAREATGIRGAGLIDTANQRIPLQSEGQAVTAGKIAGTIVARQNGANVTLGDVARVVEAPAPAVGGASVRGRPAVMLMVSSQFGANTLETTRRLDRALEHLRPLLETQGVTIHPNVFRPANFIERALHNLRTSLLIGAALIVIILFLFLFNLRTAAVSFTAIPLSLLAAIIVLDRLGYSLNTMTLGGLAIAIGEVVDDAVIDVENIFRRLRENQASAAPRSAFQVVLEASLEVRSAVVYATFAVILVFLPLLALSGVAGRIFAPLGVAYIWAILASLGTALTVTPALSLLLLGSGRLPAEEPPLLRRLKTGYRRILLGVERHPRTVIGAAGALVLAGAASLPFVGATFLPALQEGHLIVHMLAAPGTSTQESLRMGGQVTSALLEAPLVRSVSQRVGRAELSDDNAGTNASEFEVELKATSAAQTARAQEEIRRTLRDFPGLTFSMNTFLTERINETLSGFPAPVVVNLFGNDLDELDRGAQQVARALETVPGAVSVQVQSPPGMPQALVRLRPDDLARWGFDPVHVLDAVRTAYAGDVVGQVYQGNRVFDVSVILAPSDRRDVGAIRALPLRAPDGNYVTLGQLADIAEASGRYIVLHQGTRRVQAITCGVQGRSVGSFVTEAEQRIGRLRLPPGTYAEFVGTAAAAAKSRRELLLHSLLAGLGIVLLLSVVLRNARNVLLVLTNLPFALVGGVLVAWLAGGRFSLGSLVGFVTLFGITLRNSIMLISHYEHLVENESCPWNLDTMLRGGCERLGPILMTALVTGLGLLPLALGAGAPGREVEGPMAIVILGGLVTSTLLNLLVLPTLALRYGRFEKVASEP